MRPNGPISVWAR
ncbi:hypothetical protein YPPY10_4253, partial [Yersinia pestis PY-10]